MRFPSVSTRFLLGLLIGILIVGAEARHGKFGPERDASALQRRLLADGFEGDGQKTPESTNSVVREEKEKEKIEAWTEDKKQEPAAQEKKVEPWSKPEEATKPEELQVEVKNEEVKTWEKQDEEPKSEDKIEEAVETQNPKVEEEKPVEVKSWEKQNEVVKTEEPKVEDKQEEVIKPDETKVEDKVVKTEEKTEETKVEGKQEEVVKTEEKTEETKVEGKQEEVVKTEVQPWEKQEEAVKTEDKKEEKQEEAVKTEDKKEEKQEVKTWEKEEEVVETEKKELNSWDKQEEVIKTEDKKDEPKPEDEKEWTKVEDTKEEQKKDEPKTQEKKDIEETKVEAKGQDEPNWERKEEPIKEISTEVGKFENFEHLENESAEKVEDKKETTREENNEVKEEWKESTSQEKQTDASDSKSGDDLDQPQKVGDVVKEESKVVEKQDEQVVEKKSGKPESEQTKEETREEKKDVEEVKVEPLVKNIKEKAPPQPKRKSHAKQDAQTQKKEVEKSVQAEIPIQQDKLDGSKTFDSLGTGSVDSETPIDSDPDSDDTDFIDELFRLPKKLKQTAENVKDNIPGWERFSNNTKSYFNHANQQIEESFRPLIGKDYAPLVAYLVSYGLLLLPLGIVMFLFERIRAIFSLQKVLLFINIYVAAYFAALVVAAFILGGEPMDFFRNYSPSSYIFLQLLQAFGYIMFMLLQTFDLITTCSSGRIAAKFSAVLQWVVVVAVGFHYYVTVFHRAMAKSKPLTSWKVYAIYSLAFSILCLFARIERGKKLYIPVGDESTDKKN